MKKIITIVCMLLIACSLSASHIHLSLTGVTSGTHFYYCATTVDTVIVHKPIGGGVTDWNHGLGYITADSIIITLTTQGYWTCQYGPTSITEFYVNFVSIAPTQSWTATDTTKCTELSLVLTGQALGQPDFTYSWSTTATASQIMVSIPGSYSVTVSGACGIVTDTITVYDYPVPAPNLGPDVNTCDGNTVTLNPGVFSTYQWSTGANTPTIDVTTADTCRVNVTDSHGCIGKDTVIVSFILNLGEHIELVTIDTIDGNNKITWQANTPSNVTTKIYRNSSATLVGTVNYLDGTFTDNMNSVNQTWTYRISTIDSCGNESPLSPYHTTISSAVVPIVGGGFRIEWTAYSIEGGAKTVSKYHIFSTQGLGINWIVTELAVVDSNVLQYNIPLIPDSMLVVGAEVTNGSKSMEFALSNIVNNPFTGINDPIVAVHQPISPNPSTGVFVVFGEGTLSVYDAIGNIVSQAEEIHGQKVLNLFNKGTYLVVLTDHGKVFTQKVIVQ